MKPEDVPAELLDAACDRMFGTPPEPGDDREGMARALAAVLPEHERQVRAAVFVEMFGGTPEEVRAREAEAAKRPVDDPIELCERIRPGEHERQVRAKVAAEIIGRGADLRADDDNPISRDEQACYDDAAAIARGPAPDYRKVGALIVRGGRMLVITATAAPTVHCMPGGPDTGEQHRDILTRELAAELGVHITGMHPWNRYEITSGIDGALVRSAIWRIDITGEPRAVQPGRAIRWVRPGDDIELSTTARAALADAAGLLAASQPRHDTARGGA
jgi:hypothetical protein